MVVSAKGKKILKSAGYDKLRKEISRAVAEYIRDHGTSGDDLQKIVEKVLSDDRFKEFFEALVSKTRTMTSLSEKESKRCASMLVGEETCRDFERKVPDLIVSRPSRNHGRKEFYQELRRDGIVSGEYRERGLLRQVPTRSERVVDFVRSNPTLVKIICLGVGLVFLSAFLLGSVYEALVVALTLNAAPATSLAERAANILGAFGGVLLFFTTVSLIVSHLLERERKRHVLFQLTDDYLRKSK